MKQLLLPSLIVFLFTSCSSVDSNLGEKYRQLTPSQLADTIEFSLEQELLSIWYPRSVDTAHGGFLTSYTHDWKLGENQEKMIVTQSRHTWVNAKAAMRYPDSLHYLTGAAHGFKFLRNFMWDDQFGGFYTLVSRDGKVIDPAKTAYGNAFGIFALAAYYHASGDSAALNLAKKAFLWLEKNSHDPDYKGYYQHLRRDGSKVIRDPSVNSQAETGYKDQNSSIHLLEAFAELYQVWPDPLLRERLEEMLYLIRDTIATDQGYLTLFLTADWKPVSFRDSAHEVIEKHHGLDHVSFGHDVETAYLMLEASDVLGFSNDTTTLKKAKKMVDHALRNGWDVATGGFYDGGYYFKEKNGITIVKDSKTWWAQAEAMNTLLIMAEKFPDDPMNYYEKFRQLWQYIDTYVIDHTHGDWYWGGVDKEPAQRVANKGSIWKATYHHYRGMTHSIDMLRGTKLHY